MRDEGIKCFFNIISCHSIDSYRKIIETNLINLKKFLFLFFCLDFATKEKQEEESDRKIDCNYKIEETVT